MEESPIGTMNVSPMSWSHATSTVTKVSKCGMHSYRSTITVLLVTAVAFAPGLHAQIADRLVVSVNTDQADATLAIADKVGRGVSPDSADWERLFTSKGYRRLKERETGMGRAFTDSAFRAFAVSRDLSQRATALRQALDGWRSLDATTAASRALAYLPSAAFLRAEVFPVIKPQSNSFVWDLRGEPAIFFYIDPSVSAAKAENTMAHELHHVGNASACSSRRSLANANANSAMQWLTGFGEGLAMLAAAGGYDVHPHAQSDSAERAVWERDVAHWQSDFRSIEKFLLDLALGRAGTQNEITSRGMAFVNTDTIPQGPFYTVGWVVGTIIERELGRKALVESMCDGANLLHAYNRAATLAARRGESLPRWSDQLLDLLN